MIRKFLALLIVSILIQAVICVKTVSADVKPDEQARLTEKVRLGISKLGTGPESKVEVRLRDKSKLAGYIKQIDDDRFIVADAKTGAPVSVPYSNVKQVKGQNLSTGAKIGIGIAIGFLAVVAIIFATR